MNSARAHRGEIRRLHHMVHRDDATEGARARAIANYTARARRKRQSLGMR